MKTYSFLEFDIEDALRVLFDEKTKSLVLEVWKLFAQIDGNKIDPSSSITINPISNLCVFRLISYGHKSVDLKVDIFNGYFDFFINDEEVVIQSDIFSEKKIIEMIHDYLKYEAEEIVYESGDNKKIKRQLIFYKNNRKIQSIGSAMVLSYFFNKKQKRIAKYQPWII